MENKAFRNSSDRYYNMFKSGIASLIPEGSHVILDMGCAAGVLGRRLKELNKAKEVVGVEIFKEAADEAAKYYEIIHHGDIEELKLPYENYFDFVVCADILEHLRDPWNILRQVHTWLKNDGSVIICIPNVRYWRVLRDLIFHGSWRYADAGILDKTHLRFFTRRSFLGPLAEAGFEVQYMRMEIIGIKHEIANRITFRCLEEFMGKQVTIVAKKQGIV
ncbi:MAG: class I SAM-dependent methyltransferase [Thermodesulfobacteriota bacterium]